ncbi:nucleotidyltransferase domain-containing protein [Halobellus marinus]|uniref:nucleotidyltransferase domain-containing protein n=1 Tax=Halobellus TaxID=1073986 RepID=UPI0028B12722|nr:nucleotidyltransferase family protein [Halobellus sp. DFY28]
MRTRIKQEDTRNPAVEESAPEVELLRRCLLPPSMQAEPARIRVLLEEDLSWDRVLELGGSHGILPLLYRHIESTPGHDVPDAVVQRLRDRAHSTTIRNLQYTDELHGIFEKFEEESIRAMPFKGPILAAVSYDDLSLREFHDLDVLVHRQDIPAAVDLLEARGYEWVRNAPRLDDSPLLGGPYTMPLVCEYKLERADLKVEVRWRVGQSQLPFGLGFETMWDRHDTVSVAGVDLPALDPEDRLLMLAYHGTKHRWHLLKWISDFAVSLEGTDIEWSRLFTRARTYGVERKLLIGTALVSSILDYTVPEWVDRRVRNDSVAEKLAASVAAAIEDEPERPSATERLVYNATASDSPRDAFRMLLHRDSLHPMVLEYECLPLPGAFHPLYYSVVPIRLTVQKLMKALR